MYYPLCSGYKEMLVFLLIEWEHTPVLIEKAEYISSFFSIDVSVTSQTSPSLIRTQIWERWRRFRRYQAAKDGKLSPKMCSNKYKLYTSSGHRIVAWTFDFKECAVYIIYFWTNTVPPLVWEGLLIVRVHFGMPYHKRE